MNETGSLKNNLDGSINDIMAMDGVVACAIVSTEGQILGKSDSSQAPSPFLGITGATMFASGEAACSTFHISVPDYILIETKNKDGSIIVKRAGQKNLIATIINETVNISEIREKLTLISDELAEVL